MSVGRVSWDYWRLGLALCGCILLGVGWFAAWAIVRADHHWSVWECLAAATGLAAAVGPIVVLRASGHAARVARAERLFSERMQWASSVRSLFTLILEDAFQFTLLSCRFDDRNDNERDRFFAAFKSKIETLMLYFDPNSDNYTKVESLSLKIQKSWAPRYINNVEDLAEQIENGKINMDQFSEGISELQLLLAKCLEANWTRANRDLELRVTSGERGL